jgi:Protein of unknown function (DUF2971)
MTETVAAQLTPQSAVEQLFAILSPNLIEEARKLQAGESQLVHYTTAENAVNIIRSKTFWLRNVRCMNDYSEVQHGINLLVKVFGGPENPSISKLYASLDPVAPGAAKRAVDRFNEWIPKLPDITFIGCLSQADTDESTGRLSMWRAYSSPNSGVALVLDKAPFVAETDALAAYSLPVAYLTDDQFLTGIENCLNALEAFAPTLGGVDPVVVENTIFWWLLCLAVGCKHPGFHEEREWRIIYIPEMWKSQVISQTVESVRGLPQLVQKIPLIDDPENGLIGASPKNLLKRVIIGPTEFPMVQYDAFAALLTEAGIDDAHARLKLSLIPLR